MTKPLITIYDAETQETIVREMNDTEHALYLLHIEESTND
jgi:hypothetical protein